MLFHYLKFFLSPLFTLAIGLGVYIGGTAGLLVVLGVEAFVVFGEVFFGDDISKPKYKHTWLLDLALFVNVPLFFGVLFLFLHKNPIWTPHLFVYVPILGLSMSTVLINVGHELVHRTSKKLDCEIGNWALSAAWNPAFAIEHVYGHHKNVGILEEDPVTAKVNQNPYTFAFKAFFGEHIHAWGIESRQLKRRKQPIFSLYNRLIVGYIRTAIVFCVVYALFGLFGTLLYFVIGIIANYIFQMINFIEHYGLVRIKGTPILHHHSWNSNNRVTTYLTYNLTRHSDHHVNAKKEFWELDPCLDDGISLPSGYLVYIVLFSFAPFIARKKMHPRLKNWYYQYASTEEKALVEHYKHL
jgi:alkane 1-monooxygenase